jgi:hypothetical protein
MPVGTGQTDGQRHALSSQISCTCFTSSTPFELDHSYGKFPAYAILRRALWLERSRANAALSRWNAQRLEPPKRVRIFPDKPEEGSSLLIRLTATLLPALKRSRVDADFERKDLARHVEGFSRFPDKSRVNGRNGDGLHGMSSKRHATLAVFSHRLYSGHELAEEASFLRGPALRSLLGHYSLPSRFSPSSTLCQLPLDRSLERPLFITAQIRGLVLVVHCHEPDLAVRDKVVEDHPQAAALSLASSPVRPTHLSETARSGDHIARIRIAREEKLKLMVVVVAEVVREELREERRLDELHDSRVYAICVYSSRGPISCVIAGLVSGRRATWDFDCPDTYTAFMAAADASTLGDVVRRIEAGYCDQTPGGGRRWIVHYPETVAWRDETLARRPGGDGEPNIKTLIELPTFAILAPSHGPTHLSGRPYIRLSGGFHTIAAVTAEEQADLVTLARTFDAMPRSQPAEAPTANRSRDRPGDDFNRRASWAEILEPAGWRHVYDRGDVGYWCRPGKMHGVSATATLVGHDRLYVFTSSTRFERETSYSKFAAYAILHHAADFAAASRHLSTCGYGVRSTVTRGTGAPEARELAQPGSGRAGSPRARSRCSSAIQVSARAGSRSTSPPGSQPDAPCRMAGPSSTRAMWSSRSRRTWDPQTRIATPTNGD